MTKQKYKDLLRARRNQELMFFMLIGKMTSSGHTPRDVIKMTMIPRKRALYLLRKWARNDYYDHGASLDLGWLTKEIMAFQDI